MRIHYSTFSDAGRRPNNQDFVNLISKCNSDDRMFIVCDGMGGHAMGNVASRTVGMSICNYWEKNPKRKDCEKKVIDACHQASVAIDKKSDALHHVEMGTTMILASIEDNMITVAHCGDSRCYLLRSGEGVIYQTKDHVGTSFGWEVVTQCFFSYKPKTAIPEIKQFNLIHGDRLFLCTDGVYKAIEPDILVNKLMEDKVLCKITDEIQFICKKDSYDNYSGILIELD